MPEAERERIAALENAMKELKGNGRPGRIDAIETKLDNLSRSVYIGMGILGTLQVLAVPVILAYLPKHP